MRTRLAAIYSTLLKFLELSFSKIERSFSKTELSFPKIWQKLLKRMLSNLFGAKLAMGSNQELTLKMLLWFLNRINMKRKYMYPMVPWYTMVMT